MSRRPEEIELPIWWSNGHMLYNRHALDFDHPENAYNYIKRTYNVDPEDYGIERPTPQSHPNQ